jgi:hypothetical protein
MQSILPLRMTMHELLLHTAGANLLDIWVGGTVRQDPSLHALAPAASAAALPNLVYLLVLFCHYFIQQQHPTGLRPGLFVKLHA